MGISLRDRRRRRRPSYADYRPRRRPQGPRNDPFRILLYLVLIAGGIWVYFNQEATLRALDAIVNGQETAADVESSGSPAGAPQAVEQPGGQSAQEIAALAEAAYQEGKLTDAIDLYTQAAELEPNNVEYHRQVARLLIFSAAMQYGDRREATLEQAAQAANRAILADPFSPAGYAIQGKVQDWQGNPEAALSTILRALEIDSTYALGQSYYAEALMDLTRWDQALETIRYALELEPNSVDIRRDYAYILESLGDYDSAATQYEAALALHPNLSLLKMALARTYRQVGRYNEALDIFFDVQVLEPNNALVQYEIGRTYETYIGDPNTALEYFDQAVSLDESFATPWVRIGTIRYLQGSYSQAVVAFERALALGVENADVYLQLGMAYANEGRCDLAEGYLLQAQNLSQGDELILDVAQSGFEICAQPTPIPSDVLGTPVPGAGGGTDDASP
ncbi:MAG: hypothetical protein Kow00124_10490 [Anaerolineae bacterium]